MKEVFKGHVESDFDGWDGDSVFELTDGSKWEQVQYRYEYRYAYRPKARVLQDGGRFFLEVDGMCDTIEVRRN